MSVEARLYHAEQQVEHLNRQVKLLKQLITTEVTDLRKSMEQQVAEVKQVVMYQDQLYQERIVKLETRIQQLSDFCLHLARSSGQVSPSLALLPTDIVAFSSLDNQGMGQDTTTGNMKTASVGNIDESNVGTSKGVNGVLEKYKDQIDAIYDFYTTSAIEILSQTMTMTHFSRLVKDCELCGLSQGSSAELLWMAVMRSLNQKQNKRLVKFQNQSRGITLGKDISTMSKRNLFAYQRLDTIPKELFGEALYLLAMEKRRLRQLSDGTVLNDSTNLSYHSLDEKPEEILLTFLLYHIFPYVDVLMEEKQRSRGLISYVGPTYGVNDDDPSVFGKTFVIQEYKTDAVRAVVKEFMGRIKESFTTAVKTAQGHQCTRMNLNGFVEVARRHELLPLVHKPDLRHLFISCCALEKEKHSESEEGTISMGTFIFLLYHLADKIYGDALMGKKFSTPEARIKKLLSKMFLLS